MGKLIGNNLQEVIKAVSVFTDNDFLRLLFSDEELLKSILEILGDKKLYVYPFTEFEFKRDVFDPKARSLREKFISYPIFGHIKEETHLKVFPKLYINALLLSKIYAHQSNSIKNDISFVDLLLAALLMYLKDKVILITGNKKDFPSCVFDVLTVINSEQKDGNIRAISVIGFNQTKFDGCLGKLNALEQPIQI